MRFVSTPEVLERFARLEKEILQIESSVQPNERANGNVAGQAEEGIRNIYLITMRLDQAFLERFMDGNENVKERIRKCRGPNI